MSAPARVEASELRQFWDIIARRKWVIYTVVGASLAIVAARIFALDPLYRSTALVEIQRASPDILAFRDILHTDPSWQGYNAFYETQYRILRSRTVIRLAVQGMTLAGSPAPVPASGFLGRAFGALSRLVPHAPGGEDAVADPLSPWIDTLLVGLSIR